MTTSHYIKNKISKFLGILYKIRRYLDNTTLTNMYYSFVFPYLIYCVEIWGSSLKSYLDPLVKIQKKCIRTISFSEYLAPSEPLFQKLNILNIEKLVIQRICLMMFKCSIGVLPLPVSAIFQYNYVIHTLNTRRSKFIHTPIGIVYRPGYFTVHPPPPAPSGPKFSNSENCCGSENAMPPKIFWDMEGLRGHFR